MFSNEYLIKLLGFCDTKLQKILSISFANLVFIIVNPMYPLILRAANVITKIAPIGKFLSPKALINKNI